MEQNTKETNWTSFQNVILEEWPNIEVDRLNGFQDDFEGLVLFVSDTAQCTKVRARRDLEELRQISIEDQSSENKSSENQPANDTLETLFMEKFTQLEKRLQPFLDIDASDLSLKVNELKEKGSELVNDAREIIDETQKNIQEDIDRHLETTLPEVEKHIKKNLWSNLAIVFGAGIILGLLGGYRGR